jgi:putative redox protein
MKAKTVWTGKMGFAGWAASGFSVPLDSNPEAGGENGGFRPMELLLVGLAGCTARDVISILQKKRQDVTAFEVRVLDAERAGDHPRVYTDITLEYIVTGRDIDRAAVERAVQLSEEKYCSAQAMLSKTARIAHRITVLEAESA